MYKVEEREEYYVHNVMIYTEDYFVKKTNMCYDKRKREREMKLMYSNSLY